jgi:signal transduction histidine kinase
MHKGINRFWLLCANLPQPAKIGFFLLLLAVSMLAMSTVAPDDQPVVGVLSIIPVLFAGLFWGGTVGALSTFPVRFDLVIYYVTHRAFPPNFSPQMIPIAMVCWAMLGYIVGHLRDIYLTLDRAYGEARLLQDQLVAKNKESQKLSVDLARSNKELEQFAYVASHDLKEPLRKVMSFGERLTNKFGDKLGDDGKDYLTRMNSASKRMGALIDGLLAYSHVTSKSDPFADVDLAVETTAVLSDLEIRISERNGRVDVSGLPHLQADPMQMRQLMQNLVGNGLKYSRKGVPPVVAVTGNVSGGNLVITVADNGIGFEQQHAEQIFGVFQRLHGRGSEYDGTGIGLSVCRKIVERHGGTITAVGVPGQGATFTVTLPLVQHSA